MCIYKQRDEVLQQAHTVFCSHIRRSHLTEITCNWNICQGTMSEMQTDLHFQL
jgi:hypothetical protein